jgi:alkanesulfonate monooxygenase SsuD/methylene tetrahydromethanopterin reductase-like flavin-dependent oxidoreductase (luciferase family)
MFTLRFDMRSARAEHYAAAIEMARWGEEHSALAVVVSEHHASEDGYLPAPIALAAAMAAATTQVAIQVAALLVPLHDPVELAEQMAVVDLIARGRVSYVCGAGYRPEEFAMFGQSIDERGRRLESSIELMRRAWMGEPFEYEGRTCRVTPLPHTPGGPVLLLGGGTKAAVRRAVRLGLGMVTERNDGFAELYASECEAAGVEPQFFIEVPTDTVTAAFVAEDPDKMWAAIGGNILHDAQMYRSWNEVSGRVVPDSITTADSVDELRAVGFPYRVFTPDEAVEEIRTSGFLNLHPLCGGIAPELAWPSLELFASDVLPRL